MMKIVFLFFTFFILTDSSFAQDWRECTQKEESEAEEAHLLKDWQSVYNSFKKFAHCDSGAVSESYSDVIGRLLADDWKNFSKLMGLTESDFYFKRFVIEHLDETIPYDVGEKIFENAQNRCPSDANRLCKLIDCQLTLTRELAEPVSILQK
jgi:hypothetical protein